MTAPRGTGPASHGDALFARRPQLPVLVTVPVPTAEDYQRRQDEAVARLSRLVNRNPPKEPTA